MPMLGLSLTTLMISWTAFASSQLRVVSADSVFQLAQPDSNSKEAAARIFTELKNRLGITSFVITQTKGSELAKISITLDAIELPQFIPLPFPKLSAVSEAAIER